MTGNRIPAGLLALGLLTAACAFSAAASTAKPTDSSEAALEIGGPGGEVTGLVVPDGSPAGVVIWPAGGRLEGPGLPPGSAEAAARILLQLVAEKEPGARPLFRVLPAGLALGLVLPGADQERFSRALARLAVPGSVRAEEVSRRLAEHRREVRRRWGDPLEVARVGALALLFPGLDGPWEKLPPAAVQEGWKKEHVEAVWKSVAKSAVQARVAGKPGLAAAVAGALGSRLGPLEEPLPAGEAGDLPVSLALVRELPAESPGNAVGLVLGFRFTAAEGQELAPELVLMAEGLAAGEGSLRQRLDVALGKSIACRTQIVPVGRGEGALLLEMRVPRAGVAAAWRVLEGAVSSLRSMPLREDALLRARQRLDQASQGSREDPAAVLIDSLTGFPPGRPAEARWVRLPRAQEVRDCAQKVLAPARQAMVLAGPVPAATLELDSWREARRIAWNQFDPNQDGLVGEGGPPGEAEREAGRTLAQKVFQVLSGGLSGGIEPAFRARYKVREETPFGAADLTMVVKGGPGGNSITVEGEKWTVTAEQKEQGSEALVTSPQEATFSLPQAGRLDSLVFREPVVLLGAVLSNQVTASAARSLCGDQPCPALRAELPDGTVLRMDLDPATSFPFEMRIWWPGKDESRIPDQRVRYLGWKEEGGTRVAAEFTVEDALGSIRRVWLLDWDFESSAPARL